MSKADWTAEITLPQAARVTDGDTYWLYTKGFYRQIHYVETRLSGYDTPERAGPSKEEKRFAEVAAEFVRAWLLRGLTMWVTTKPDPEKHGRWLGDLHDSRGEHLGVKLAEVGLAVPYAGRGPRWRDAYLPPPTP